MENFTERSVILSEGPVLRAPLSELRPQSVSIAGAEDETLAGRERAHIIQVLRECSGQIAGEKAAAVRLGAKRTTLQSKMRRLKITRKEYMG
jgi:transcriptional regulator with GAF, ATPase, and Fis domain